MSDSRTIVIPLNRKNYVTWKVQCCMALIKDGLLSIVNGSEVAPEGNAELVRKCKARSDRVLVMMY